MKNGIRQIRLLENYESIHDNFIKVIKNKEMDRNENLLQKINEINSNFNLKTNRYHTAWSENLQNKLEQAYSYKRMTKKKIRAEIQKNKSQLQIILKDGEELCQRVQKSNAVYQHESKQLLDKLKKIESKLSKKIEIQMIQRKQNQNSIIGMFEQKADQLKKQIEKQRKQRQNLFLEISNTLEEDLPFIMQELTQRKQQFQIQEQEVARNCVQMLGQTQKQVNQFTQEQENHSSKAFELIKDLTKKIRMEIEEQKAACTATHEEVLSYVEETCSKLVQY